MIAAPPNFITANAAFNKRPIVVVQIAGYWRAFTTYADLGPSGSIGVPFGTGNLTIPPNAGPWKYNDPGVPYHLTGSVGPPAQIPILPGQYVRVTYKTGLVNASGASYSSYGIGFGSTAGGIYPWPSDRCMNGGYPRGSANAMCIAFTDASGNVIGGATGPITLAYLQPFVWGPAPAGTTHLNIGVNSYADWSGLTGGGWQIQYELSNTGVAGDPYALSGSALGGVNSDWIETFGDLALTVNELEGSAQIGGFSFTALDKDGDITADFPSFVFEGKSMTVKTGFPGMDLADYALLFTGAVDTVVSENDNQSYTFNCVDNMQALTKVIYQTADDGQPTSKDHIRTLNAHPLDLLLSILTNEIGLDPTMMNQAKILAYRDGVFVGQQFQFSIDSPPQASDFIEHQIMKPLGGYLWTNNKGQVDVNFFYKDTRPAVFFACLIAAWTDGTGQIIGHPFAPGLDAVLTAPTGATQLQLGVNDYSWGGDGSGSWTITVNGTSYTVYSNNAPWQFTGGINAAFPFASSGSSAPVVVPVTAGSSYHIHYVGGLLAAHVTLTGLGNYRDVTGVEPQIAAIPANTPSAWVVQPWLRAGSVLSINDDLMTAVPMAGQVALINQVSYRFDQSAGSNGQFNTESVTTFQTSVDRYKQYGAQVIESAGMRSGLQGVYLGAQVANLLFHRYGLKNLTFPEVDLLWSACIVEPGDIVDVTSTHVPNRITGAMGVSGMLFEVFDRTWDLNAGICKVRLLDASYITTLGTALIAPSGMPDWTSASTAQKARYMFLCNDSDQYSDGSAAQVLG